MDRHVIGWLFVAAQAILLIAMVAFVGRDDWDTSGWVQAIGYVLVGAGLLVVAAGALRLGAALTPTPVPTQGAELTTSGLYRFVRHPIYTGVLAAVIGVAVSAGSLPTALIAAATIAFFNVKARWEEARLAERYPDYPAYAATTPRFLPRLRGPARR